MVSGCNKVRHVSVLAAIFIVENDPISKWKIFSIFLNSGLFFSGMEKVWVQQFNDLFFNYFPHQWYIQPVEQKPFGGNSLVTFVDSAKVRFCCDVSNPGGTCMHTMNNK